MIRHLGKSIVILCDGPDCDSREEICISDMIAFKEEVRDEGWHIRKHQKCFCMDCWDAGHR
jgi:hypothetical protein